VALTAFLVTPAGAEGSIFIPLFTYRTGQFGVSGIPRRRHPAATFRGR
jgi:hypothetical protein